MTQHLQNLTEGLYLNTYEYNGNKKVKWLKYLKPVQWCLI